MARLAEQRNWSIFNPSVPFSARSAISFDHVKEVAKFKDFTALLTLTAWAREAREHNFLIPNAQAALYARKIFASAICNTPHLFIRWPLLAIRYKELIWSYPVTEISEPWINMKWEELMSEMVVEEKKARERGVKLPPKNIFERINEKELALLQG